MNHSLVEKLIKDCVIKQTRWDNAVPLPQKVEAKRYGYEQISEYVTRGRILDLGGEEFYHDLYKDYDLVTINLPHDMHQGIVQDGMGFDAVLAMHVLEHSPFPLYVLALINDALNSYGYLYVALPTHTTDAFCEIEEHFTIMPTKMWERLFKEAGFTIISHDIGKFGNTPDWVEERFLCRKST